MSKRKRGAGKSKGQSSAALRNNGLKAFERGDYNQAIEVWERVEKQSHTQTLAAALAEAYFRRGLKSSQSTYSDLKKAAQLRPDDPRYIYHMGLDAHRQGRLSEAIAAYQQVRRTPNEFARRSAYPLALALQQQGDDVTTTAVWQALTAAEQALLQVGQAFLRRPYRVAEDAAPLWQGLAAFDNGRFAAARDHLAQALRQPNVAGVSHYYLGAIAAHEDQWQEAAHHWSAARAAGFSSPHLHSNLGGLYHRLAEERLSRQDAEGALLAATEANRRKDNDKQLNELIAQAQQHLAYQAASEGDWETAQVYWEMAQEQAGGSFRLAYNLALVYEKMEDFFTAAGAWREALRRRPRRADHPDAISNDQVARLWQRAAEAYVKVGEFEEAIRVYKQAVKWQPDNVTIRLALAEGLLNEGRLQASENELQHILEREPDNIPALLRMGEVVSQYDSWWYHSEAIQYWRRALEIEPGNETAKQYLVDFYQDQAESWLQWRNDYERAIEAYEKALAYQPENGEIQVAIGRCYLLMGQESKGQTYMDQAWRDHPADLNVHTDIIISWLAADRPEIAWEVMTQVEATMEDVPPTFYTTLANNCLYDGQPDLAQPFIDRAIEKSPPDFPIFLAIGEMAAIVGGVEELARTYLEKAIAADQLPGQAYLMLGIVAAKAGDLKTAEKQWRAAEKIARKHGDNALSGRIKSVRAFFSDPLSFFTRLLGDAPPGSLGALSLPDFLAGMLDDFEDEEEGDDFFDF